MSSCVYKEQKLAKMEKPNKEDFKYKIRTGNNLSVCCKTNWELFAKDLEEWTDKQLLIHSVSQCNEQVCTLHRYCEYQSGLGRCSYLSQCDYKKQTCG